MPKPTAKTDDELLQNVEELSASAYLNAADVKDGPLTFTIEASTIEAFEKDGEKEKKLVLILDGTPTKKLTVNATNRATFSAAWTTNALRWIGKTFDAFYDGSVRNPSGVKTGGVRVRVRELVKPATVRRSKTNGAAAASIATAPEPELSHDDVPF